MRLGAYETVRELGRGGQSVVYRARAPGGRDVAIKLIAAASQDERDRFERERRLHAALGEAEGFVPLLDSGNAREGLYLVMPLLQGGTLRDRLKRGALSIAETQRLGVALARAIGRAHALGIVHRDLKPENVLFASIDSPAPLIADLGLAKHWVKTDGSPASLNLSSTGETRGTIGYMSREQMFEPASVGAPADVFALGAILYQSLTGTSAFGSAPAEILKRIEAGSLTKIRELRPDVPALLAQAVERSLARDAKDRFANGTELARALAPPELERRHASARSLHVSAGLGFGVALLGALALVALFLFDRYTEAERAGRIAEARSLEQEAAKRHAQGDDKGALDVLARSIALDPSWAPAHRERGFLLDRRGDHAAALEALARALELEPAAAETYRVRAVVRAHGGDPLQAAADLDQALALDPKSGAAWKDRGDLRVSHKDYEGAVADYSRAIEVDSRNALAWFARGRLRRAQQHDPKGAVGDFDHAIELEPKNGTAWNERANALMVQGDYQSALADVQRASELLPENAAVFCNRGIAKRHLGDLAGARLDLDHAITLDPRSVSALLERATVKLALADTATAVTDLTQALEIDSSNVPGWRLLCSAQFARGDLAGTRHAFTELTQVEPRLAWARPDDAPVAGSEKARADWLATDPGLKPILQALAQLECQRAVSERDRGDIKAALLDFQHALTLDPQSFEAKTGLDGLRAVLNQNDPH